TAGSGVALSRSATSARRYIELEAANARSAPGGKLEVGGMEISEVSTFAVSPLRDSVGIRAKTKLGRLTTWLTVTLFREGAVVGDLVVFRTDARDGRASLRGLAIAQDRRIRAVLSGRIHNRR